MNKLDYCEFKELGTNVGRLNLIFENYSNDKYMTSLKLLYFNDNSADNAVINLQRIFEDDVSVSEKYNEFNREKDLKLGKPIECKEFNGLKYISNKTPYNIAKEFLECVGLNESEVNQLLNKLYHIDFIEIK